MPSNRTFQDWIAMNTTPRLCVELNGCIANNLAFMGMPDFGPPTGRTPPIIGAFEALAWLNGPFAYAGEVHLTISCEDAEFHEQAVQWLITERFSLRTGIMQENIHEYVTLDELAKLASGLHPTIAVGAHVQPLTGFLLARQQLLLDPHDCEQHEYHAVRQTRMGVGIQRVTDWHEIMQLCLRELADPSLT